MVDVSKTPYVAPVFGSGSHDEPGRHHPPEEGHAKRRRPGPREGVEDVAFIMGVPAAELTPKTTEALKFIMGEYDRVRYELDVSRDRETHLQSLADAHPILPVLNRRALMREMNQILQRSATAGTEHTFICMSLINGTDFRMRFGLAAADAALAGVARTLAAGLRASDVLGSLGGYDFGIVLTLADGPSAARKADQLVASVRDRPPEWADVVVEAKMAWGLRVLAPDDTSETVIDAADADLRARGVDHFR
jgi:diguanylate cyclase (GGDEF)-like protein